MANSVGLIRSNSSPGATPNSLALSPDDGWLFVANANINCVAVFEVEKPGHSRSLGFIPTGWYPTSVRVAKGGKLLVAHEADAERSLGLSKERVIAALEHRQPDRVPVVFVHGTASSPIWWADMWNTLRADAQLRELYDLMKWGPTSVNCCPARIVFIRSLEAKERLKPALDRGNVGQTMAAPVTAIVA